MFKKEQMNEINDFDSLNELIVNHYIQLHSIDEKPFCLLANLFEDNMKNYDTIVSHRNDKFENQSKENTIKKEQI